MVDIRKYEVAADFFGPDSDAVTSSPLSRVAIGGISFVSASDMDPLTLTTRVREAVTPVAITLRSCQRRAARFKIAALSIASLYTECSALWTGLQRIKTLMARDRGRALMTGSGLVIEENYSGILEFSWLLINVISKHLTTLKLTEFKAMS